MSDGTFFATHNLARYHVMAERETVVSVLSLAFEAHQSGRFWFTQATGACDDPAYSWVMFFCDESYAARVEELLGAAGCVSEVANG